MSLAIALGEGDTGAVALKRLQALLDGREAPTVLVSSEYLEKLQPDGIRLLGRYVAESKRSARIVLYLRQYDDWIRSRYLQRARASTYVSRTKARKRKSQTFDDFFPKGLALASVRAAVMAWSQVFGRDALHVRHVATLPKGDVVGDFLSLVGAESVGTVATRNVSPHWLSVELAKAMLQSEPVLGTLNQKKSAFTAFLESLGEDIRKVGSVEYLTVEQRSAARRLYMEEADWLHSFVGTPVPPPLPVVDDDRPFLPSLEAAPEWFFDVLRGRLELLRRSEPYLAGTLENVLNGTRGRPDRRSPRAGEAA